jgi:hypothetical protein
LPIGAGTIMVKEMIVAYHVICKIKTYSSSNRICS